MKVEEDGVIETKVSNFIYFSPLIFVHFSLLLDKYTSTCFVKLTRFKELQTRAGSTLANYVFSSLKKS